MSDPQNASSARLGPELRAPAESRSSAAHLTQAPSNSISQAPRPPAKGTAYDTDNCTWLQIQYNRKDQAKRLGARWDALTKRWYVPHYVALAPFLEAGLLKTGSSHCQPSKGRATHT